MDSGRVDRLVDVGYGVLLFVSVVLLTVIGQRVGIAFAMGVFVAYLLHVVWKMARYDPEWMARTVEETVEKTVGEQVDRAVGEQVEETVEDTVEETIERTVDDEVLEEANEEADGDEADDRGRSRNDQRQR